VSALITGTVSMTSRALGSFAIVAMANNRQ
jgi:hypothetical protein